MGCQCSEPNKDKQVLVEENKQAVPEDDSNSKSNMNLTPQNDNNNNENEKEQKNEQEEHPQIQNSNPEPPKEEKKEEPSTPKEQENKDPNIEVIKEDNQEKEVPKPIEKVKASKPKYDISKYPKDVFDLINKIREDPPKFAEDVEKAISLIKEENGKLILETDKLSLSYDERPFSSQGFTITLKDSGEVWNFGDAYGNGEGNFFGTVRTLDNTHGAIPLDKGLFSWKGTSIIDDSKTAILLDNGETEDRKNNEIDVYFFGYGKDYKAGLKAFAALTGKTPMIPRYALGNWWSKFEKYTEDSYIEMLDSFDAEKVAFVNETEDTVLANGQTVLAAVSSTTGALTHVFVTDDAPEA